jgi:transposase
MLKLNLARWRCRTPKCRYRIFRERLPSVVARYARHTNRLTETGIAVGRLLGGRPSQGLLSRLGMPVSRHTVLRRVKDAVHKLVRRRDIRVVGVDDWAWKKGQSSFGTILVDLENHQVVDLLPTRSAEVLSAWLEQHPEVAVVARDRQGLYAEGARRGAPDAIQVADRFHLIQNLRQAVERALAVQRPHLRLTAGAAVVPPSFQIKEGRRMVVRSTVTQKAAEAVHQRWQEKLELFHAVKNMQAAGMRVKEMAEHLGVNRRRLDKWARLEELPERSRMQPRPGMVEWFRHYLRHRWEQGCRHGRTLLAEIRQLGYTGGHSQLAKLLSPWRQAPVESDPRPTEVAGKTSIQLPGRAISPQVAAALLSKLPAELSNRQADIVARLKQQCPGFAAMRKLVMGFRTILRAGKVSTLHRWMEQALNTGIHAIVRFVRTLKQDMEAVEAAVSQPWSNGPVEGQINRLKMLKRQMYGRGGTELLRARLLPDPIAA